MVDGSFNSNVTHRQALADRTSFVDEHEAALAQSAINAFHQFGAALASAVMLGSWHGGRVIGQDVGKTAGNASVSQSRRTPAAPRPPSTQTTTRTTSHTVRHLYCTNDHTRFQCSSAMHGSLTGLETLFFANLATVIYKIIVKQPIAKPVR